MLYKFMGGNEASLFNALDLVATSKMPTFSTFFGPAIACTDANRR